MYFEFAYQPHKLFLLSKPIKHFSLIISYGYDALPFCLDNVLVLFYDDCCILGFFYLVGFLV